MLGSRSLGMSMQRNVRDVARPGADEATVTVCARIPGPRRIGDRWGPLSQSCEVTHRRDDANRSGVTAASVTADPRLVSNHFERDPIGLAELTVG